MVIGLPRAFLWHRYGVMWQTFFTSLGCEVVTSAPSNVQTLETGSRFAMSECCLPAKIFMGHVQALAGRCDYILVPYVCPKRGGNSFCARFWGLADAVRALFDNVRLLDIVICGDAYTQYREYMRLGKILGKRVSEIREAYRAGVLAQKRHDNTLALEQEKLEKSREVKILIAGHSYVLHDPVIGAPIAAAVRESGGVPLFSDRLDRAEAHAGSTVFSPRLYWTANRETIGAIAAKRENIDGAVILTAFPCAPDALSGEMAIRKTNGLPIARFTLDGLNGDAGVATRVESFMDILLARKGVSYG